MKFTSFCILTVLCSAQSFGQSAASQNTLQDLLSRYDNVKETLVSGNAKASAAQADEFIKVTNTIDYKIISEGNINALLKDATTISTSTDIGAQRNAFASLSSNMIEMARALKLTDKQLYVAYCPMKKASWLTDKQEIRNPYYGDEMLNCGKIVDTIPNKNHLNQ